MMKIVLLSILEEQKSVIQNLARFYAYDLSKSCGFYNLFDGSFWKKLVSEYTNNDFSQDRKIFSEPEAHENIVLKFKTQ